MKTRGTINRRPQQGGTLSGYLLLYILLWILPPVMILSGCAVNREYAELRSSAEVAEVFRSDRLLPQYRYYSTGPDGQPIALMALDKEYALLSMFWHEFRSDYQLRQWIKEIDRSWGQLDDLEYVTIIYKGWEILSPDNRRIGMIYSRYQWFVAWWGEGGKGIFVTRPEPGGNQRAPFFLRRWHDE